jgi:hypothetical protein
MTDLQINADGRDEQVQPAAGMDQKPISMHENVPVWCDCCTCAAEPYWLAVAEELGIDLDAPQAPARDTEQHGHTPPQIGGPGMKVL